MASEVMVSRWTSSRFQLIRRIGEELQERGERVGKLHLCKNGTAARSQQTGKGKPLPTKRNKNNTIVLAVFARTIDMYAKMKLSLLWSSAIRCNSHEERKEFCKLKKHIMSSVAELYHSNTPRSPCRLLPLLPNIGCNLPKSRTGYYPIPRIWQRVWLCFDH
ncbi:hypothetical protein AA313_de0202022 [Arthrobotrys entomopaga]|nr:hypothetical protein AA313_de0202022 [Arthrobotrys entomopaga]